MPPPPPSAAAAASAAASMEAPRPPAEDGGNQLPKKQQQQHKKKQPHRHHQAPFDAAAAAARRAQLQAQRRALPLWGVRESLLRHVAASETLIVVGETGSGKTTQIPQFLLEAGYAGPWRGSSSSGGGNDGGGGSSGSRHHHQHHHHRAPACIAVTQPRRVAAITVATRVAEELGVRLGREVGYSIRFEDASSAATRVRYLTDGMLLREALVDPLLARYSVVVVDEAHERSVHTDVLLGLLKQVQARRRAAAAAAAGEAAGAAAGSNGQQQQQEQQRQEQQGPQPHKRRKHLHFGDDGDGGADAQQQQQQDNQELGRTQQQQQQQWQQQPSISAVGPLRLLVMSATLDAGAFSAYFDGAPAVWARGRSHPVQVYYAAHPEDNYLDAALSATLQVHADEPPGDVLVFLTGQEEIEALARLLGERAALLLPDGGYGNQELLVLPIYAALPPEQQVRVFEPAPPGARKAILATNIAETSITVPGVRYVVDAGFVKARGYSARLGADSLQVVPVSQAQARQRSGRAGREAPGKAFRLYTEAAFAALPPATPPEITRVNLGSVVLQLKALGVRDVLNFDFMDAPPRAAVVRALELLYALGALDGAGDLTQDTGAALARLPVDPMYGKVLLAGAASGCGLEAAQLVAVVSTENVFFSPRGKGDAVASTRAKFLHPDGDQLTALAALKAYLGVERRRRAEWCADNFLNARALRRALDVAAQLEAHLQALGLPLRSCGADPVPVCRALTAGLFPHAARRQADGSYRVLATGQQVHLHPSSVLRGKAPECVVFGELVRTTKQYARDVARVQARWLPELAPALFKIDDAVQVGGSCIIT